MTAPHVAILLVVAVVVLPMLIALWDERRLR